MIEFILKKDKKHNSLCQIKKDETVIYLTEKDLSLLIEDIYEKRPDALEGMPILERLKQEIEEKSDKINSLCKEIDKMQSDIDDMWDEINELRGY